MVPCSFKEENCLLDMPPEIAQLGQPLPVCIGMQENSYPVVISCWKVTKEELEEIKRTGRIYLIVLGTMHPPVDLVGISPFQKIQEDRT
jgi:hypothetical protein